MFIVDPTNMDMRACLLQICRNHRVPTEYMNSAVQKIQELTDDGIWDSKSLSKIISLRKWAFFTMELIWTDDTDL